MIRARVLIAIDKAIDPRVGGGVGLWADLLRRGLEAQGHEVMIAGPGGSGSVELPGDTPQSRSSSLVETCRRSNIQVVVSASSDTARMAAPQLPDNCRHVVTVHSAKPAHVAREVGDAERAWDAIVGCSRSVTMEILRHCQNRSRVFSVPNGVPSEESPAVPLGERAKVITVVGRQEVEQKRSHWLPMVYSELNRLDSEIDMTVIGGGNLTHWLKKFASGNDGFHVLGQLDRVKVGAYLRTTPRLLFIPSAYEGLSFVLLEALASGCPVALAADERVTGGEVDGRHALLLDLPRSPFLTRRNAQRVAASLHDAVENVPSLDAQVGRAATLVRRSHSLEAMSEGYSEVIETVMSLPPARVPRTKTIGPYRARPVENLVSRLAPLLERHRVGMRW